MQIEISVNKSFSHDAYNSSSLRVSLPPTLPLFADKGDRVFATRQIKKRKHTMTKIRILPREVQTIRIHNISTRTVEKHIQNAKHDLVLRPLRLFPEEKCVIISKIDKHPWKIPKRKI